MLTSGYPSQYCWIVRLKHCNSRKRNFRTLKNTLNSVVDPISEPVLNFLPFPFLLFVFRWTAEDRLKTHQPTDPKSKPVPREFLEGISVSIIFKRDATQRSLFIILQVHSTCFGCQPHPTSGVHKTVTTASGTVQLPPSNVAKLAWQSIYYSASSLYMFRVSAVPIVRSTQNC